MGVYDDMESLMSIDKKRVLEAFAKNLKIAIDEYNLRHKDDIKKKVTQKLTQRLIAFDIFEDLGITEGRMKSKFTEMKKGNSDVSIHYYIRICKIIGMTLYELFDCYDYGIINLEQQMIDKCQQVKS